MSLLEVTDAFVDVREGRRFAPSKHELLTMNQAADVLHVSRPTMSRLVRVGDLPAVKVEGRWQLVRLDVENLSAGRQPKLLVDAR